MLFWICAAAPFAFLIVSLLLGFTTSNYNHFQTTISYLVHGDHGLLQTVNFVVSGILVLGLTYLIRNVEPVGVNGVQLVKIGALTLGLSLLLLGIFPTDKAGEQTVIGQIHGLIFIVSVLIQATTQITFAFQNRTILLANTFWITGIITAIGLPSMMLFRDWRGLIQKIFVGGIMWWVTVGALIIKR